MGRKAGFEPLLNARVHVERELAVGSLPYPTTEVLGWNKRSVARTHNWRARTKYCPKRLESLRPGNGRRECRLFLSAMRSEERRVGKSVDVGGRRVSRKKGGRRRDTATIS